MPRPRDPIGVVVGIDGIHEAQRDIATDRLVDCPQRGVDGGSRTVDADDDCGAMGVACDPCHCRFGLLRSRMPASKCSLDRGPGKPRRAVAGGGGRHVFDVRREPDADQHLGRGRLRRSARRRGFCRHGSSVMCVSVHVAKPDHRRFQQHGRQHLAALQHIASFVVVGRQHEQSWTGLRRIPTRLSDCVTTGKLRPTSTRSLSLPTPKRCGGMPSSRSNGFVHQESSE